MIRSDIEKQKLKHQKLQSNYKDQEKIDAYILAELKNVLMTNLT